MLTRIRQLLELVRFSHTLFALPFALLAALMAWRVNSAEYSLKLALADSAIPDVAPEYSVSELNQVLRNFNYPAVTQYFAWRWQELLGILMCMVSARSAAMAFNR